MSHESYAIEPDCKSFMETFQEIAESQKTKEESKDAAATAGLLEKLTVEEKESEVKTGEKEGTDKRPEPEKADAEKKAGCDPSA